MNNYDQNELQSILGSSSKNSKPPVSIENDLITCLYDGDECTARDFISFQLDEFHTCYTFNSGRDNSSSSSSSSSYSSSHSSFSSWPTNGSATADNIRKVRRYGKNYGLHVELFLGMPETCKSPLSRNYGLVVYIHNSTYTVWDETNGFEIMSGYETDVAVDRTRLIKLPEPYSGCVVNTVDGGASSVDDVSQLVRDTFRVAPSYTQQTCLQLCLQDYYSSIYSCYDPYLPYINRSAKFPLCGSGKTNLTSSYFADKVGYEKKYTKYFFVLFKAPDFIISGSICQLNLIHTVNPCVKHHWRIKNFII